MRMRERKIREKMRVSKRGRSERRTRLAVGVHASVCMRMCACEREGDQREERDWREKSE